MRSCCCECDDALDLERKKQPDLPWMVMTDRIERRTSLRIPLHTSVYVLLGPEQDVMEAKTKNLSIRGFYCLSQHALAPGQNIDCVVVIATPGEVADSELRLRCKAQVLRVESTTDPESPFGIACHIETYEVLGHLPGDEGSGVS